MSAGWLSALRYILLHTIAFMDCAFPIICLFYIQEYDGRVTVPVLYDKQTKSIVNNESSEIIRMLNTEFNEFCATPEQKALDLYPPSMRKEIDAVNEWIYP